MYVFMPLSRHIKRKFRKASIQTGHVIPGLLITYKSSFVTKFIKLINRSSPKANKVMSLISYCQDSHSSNDSENLEMQKVKASSKSAIIGDMNLFHLTKRHKQINEDRYNSQKPILFLSQEN